MNANVLSVIIASTCLSACMLSPADGDSIGSTTTPVRFEGYDYNADSPVVIEGRNPATNLWDQIATVRTSATPVRYDGIDWYQWTVTRQIPAHLWRPGIKGGHFSRIRARNVSRDMETVIPDWERCSIDHPGVLEFLSHCRGTHSPTAYVFTSAYPTAGGVDVVLTDISVTTDGAHVRVENGGMEGIVKRVSCSAGHSHAVRTIDERIQIGEVRVFTITSIRFFPGARYECVVEASNPDGSPEAITSDNIRSEIP